MSLIEVGRIDGTDIDELAETHRIGERTPISARQPPPSNGLWIKLWITGITFSLTRNLCPKSS